MAITLLSKYSIWGLIQSCFKPLFLNDLKRESKNINQLNNNKIDEMLFFVLFLSKFLFKTQHSSF